MYIYILQWAPQEFLIGGADGDGQQATVQQKAGGGGENETQKEGLAGCAFVIFSYMNLI